MNSATYGSGRQHAAGDRHQNPNPPTYQAPSLAKTEDPTQQKYEYDAFASYRRRDSTLACAMDQWPILSSYGNVR
jgi:hypothetical protein